MKILPFIFCSFILTGCGDLKIAPGESWDNDDTRIWINEASGFNPDPHWFKERSSTPDSTVLDYNQEFEKNMADQILGSDFFDYPAAYDSLEAINKRDNMVKGIWISAESGFRFLQLKGSQYPITIYVDTVRNIIVAKTIK